MQKFDVSRDAWALIVMNAQVDYCDEEKGSRLVQGVAGDPAMEVATDNIVALIAKPFKRIVVSSDVHPRRPDTTEQSVEQSLSGEKSHCIERTPGVHLIPKIEQALVGKSSKPIRKGDHPSLISNSIGTSPEFSTHVSTLRGHNVKHVVICGFPFNSAVAMTAIEHVNQQFEHVYIVMDATRSDEAPSRNPEQMKQALELLGVELVKTNDFV
jgi:nicotinamidase-related amidase